MKKNDLINNQLLSMGYLPLPYNKDCDKVFYKEMDNGLIVCVGIVSSSLYQDRRKTVSFYMALSYTWAMHSPILLPQDCYLRIGEILDKNEIICGNLYNKRQKSMRSKATSYYTTSSRKVNI